MIKHIVLFNVKEGEDKDAVADVAESGRTLKDAGLKVTGEAVMTSEAIVVARDKATAESEQVVRFLKRINGIVLAREYVMIEYDILKDKLERYESKGMTGRRLFAMVLGIPNVGKSSFINRLAGAKRTKVEDRPGVTRDKQWVQTKYNLDLLDMPGVLWPKFDDKTIGENLALTGAVKDDVVDTVELAVILVNRMREQYPELLCSRYKLTPEDIAEDVPVGDIFDIIGKNRGFLLRGGEINYDRAAAAILDEFRAAKIGRITLDICPCGSEGAL